MAIQHDSEMWKCAIGAQPTMHAFIVCGSYLDKVYVCMYAMDMNVCVCVFV